MKSTEKVKIESVTSRDGGKGRNGWECEGEQINPMSPKLKLVYQVSNFENWKKYYGLFLAAIIIQHFPLVNAEQCTSSIRRL